LIFDDVNYYIHLVIVVIDFI